MPKFLPGHPKIPGSGRKKGQKNGQSKGLAAPSSGTIRGFLETHAWYPLKEVFDLLPKLSEFQQARINMEIIAMEQKERLATGGEPPKGEDDDTKRYKTMGAAEFVASLPVKLDEPNGNGAHPSASS